MLIYKCGTEVIIKDSATVGNICSVSIQYDNTSYEIKYYHNGVYNKVWCKDTEFDTKVRKTKIGFIN